MARRESPQPFPLRKIMVTVDGSENSKRAARVAIRLAKDYRANLVVVNVLSVPSLLVPVGLGSAPMDFSSYYDFVEKEARTLVDGISSDAKSQGVSAASEIVRGTTSVVETITETAEKENADLIVIGTRGLGGFKKMLMGSVSSGVVSHANCPVLVVR